MFISKCLSWCYINHFGDFLSFQFSQAPVSHGPGNHHYLSLANPDILQIVPKPADWKYQHSRVLPPPTHPWNSAAEKQWEIKTKRHNAHPNLHCDTVTRWWSMNLVPLIISRSPAPPALPQIPWFSSKPTKIARVPGGDLDLLSWHARVLDMETRRGHGSSVCSHSRSWWATSGDIPCAGERGELGAGCGRWGLIRLGRPLVEDHGVLCVLPWTFCQQMTTLNRFL